MADNVMTRKLGPLPTWGWITIAGAGVVGVALWERRSVKTGSANTGVSAASTQPPEVFQLTPPEQDTDIDVDDDDDPRSRHRRRHHKKHPPKRHHHHDVVVPNVVGQAEKTGAERLQDAGLRARTDHPFTGTIRTERPTAGQRVKRGTSVLLSDSYRPS